nr:hypothetical protein [Burkholderia cepacia]
MAGARGSGHDARQVACRGRARPARRRARRRLLAGALACRACARATARCCGGAGRRSTAVACDQQPAQGSRTGAR